MSQTCKHFVTINKGGGSEDMLTHTGLTPFDPSARSKWNSLCCVDEQGKEAVNNPAGSCSLQKMPVCPVHDEETPRICSVSVETVPEFPRMISQTTRRHMGFTKSSDQVIRDSKLSTEGNAKPALYELLSSSSPGSGYKQAPELQYIAAGDTTSSGVRARNSSQPCLQKELSADTDVLGIGDLGTTNSSPGVAPFPSIKDLYVSKNPITAREVGSRKAEMVVPNICEDSAPVMTTARCLTGKRSTSITSEELCVPEAQPNRSKRLKLNACDSHAQGTGTSLSEAESSGRNGDQLFAITSEDLVKNQNESDRSLVVFEKLDFSSMDSMQGHKELTLSHPWIQRLRPNQQDAKSMKLAAGVIYEPRIPIPKQQLPSSAAMALMAKASYGIRPCEFKEKRGSVTFWSKGCF